MLWYAVYMFFFYVIRNVNLKKCTKNADSLLLYYPFKCQPHKIVKHIQKIRQQFADKLFECV